MQFLTNLNLAKNELQNVVIQNLSVAPSAPKEGQIYYNSGDHVLYQYKGEANGGWAAVGIPYNLPVASQSELGGIKIGAGLSITPQGTVSVNAGGVADSVPWTGVLDKPFDELNTVELEVTGAGSARKLGIKEVPQSKVTGLTDALAGKISEVKRNGVALVPTSGSVNITVPTNTNELTNGAAFITSAQAPVQKVNNKTGDVTLTAADVGAVPTGRKVNGKALSADVTLTPADVGSLATAGGTMSGDIAMGSHKITGLANGSNSGDAVNKGQLDTAIAGLGTVFDLKGSKPTVSALPPTGEIGDVWYVEDVQVGYIWITDTTHPSGHWEQLGATIDLSGYLTKAGLLTTTGSATNNTMTQKAITDSLALKANSSDMTTQLGLKADKSVVNAIPVVKTVNGTIAADALTTTVNYTGTLLNAFAKDANGEEVITDQLISAGNVKFTCAQAPNAVITCTVVYM